MSKIVFGLNVFKLYKGVDIMYKIENEFTNNKGQTFFGLRTIHIEKMKDLPKGESLINTSVDSENYYDESGDIYGVMINESLLDSNKAFRIYKDWTGAWNYIKADDEFIYELQKRQNKIKLTDFPTGIITLDKFPTDTKRDGFSKVIGQEILFYKNSITVGEYFFKNKDIDYLNIYISILKILKELLNNGIYYDDIYQENFVINKLTSEVKLIDFEPSRVKFQVTSQELKDTLRDTKNLFIRLCELGNIKLRKSFRSVSTLDELEEHLNNEYKFLKH